MVGGIAVRHPVVPVVNDCVYYLLSTRLTYREKLACIIFALQKGKKNSSYFPAGEDGEIGEMLMYLKRMYGPLESIFFPS